MVFEETPRMSRMTSNHFWLNDEAWSLLEPMLPKNQPGARRVDDRRVSSGIFHVLRSGCRWRDCPPEYGPRTTIYNRFNRWSRRKIWQQMLTALTDAGHLGGTVAVDSTYVKAHRSAAGAQKKRRRIRRLASREAGDRPRFTLPPTSSAGRSPST
jgi:transposase